MSEVRDAQIPTQRRSPFGVRAEASVVMIANFIPPSVERRELKLKLTDDWDLPSLP